MAWFRRKKKIVIIPKKKEMPEGLWTKCDECNEIVYNKELEENFKVCPKCDFHFNLSPAERIKMLLDPLSFVEINKDMKPVDTLDFVDSKTYTDRLKEYQNKTGYTDAVITGEGEIEKIKTAFSVMDGTFMRGSMGAVVGEKITRIIEFAIEKKLPYISVAASGGARMQEGIFSLMQMAKTGSALADFSKKRLLYISILTHPTSGGVTASFASLGDIIIAEPRALICFAGPRVIKETIGEELPEGFQRAEFLRDHGMIDMVIKRQDLKATVARMLKMVK
jgi:acetyl-CoA carboxylase carboxyl transferase subunit beta